MNNQDNTVFLKDILDCIAKIERYLQEYNFEKFQNDELVIDAVVRNVEIIGEASSNLSRDFRSKNVQMEIIWNITQNNLPALKTEIEKILENIT
jgi:uncharacterized protein with HEPN domain